MPKHKTRNDSVKIKAIGRDIDDNDYDEDAAAAVDNISSFGSGVAFAVVVRDVFFVAPQKRFFAAKTEINYF